MFSLGLFLSNTRQEGGPEQVVVLPGGLARLQEPLCSHTAKALKINSGIDPCLFHPVTNISHVLADGNSTERAHPPVVFVHGMHHGGWQFRGRCLLPSSLIV
jgi:hypothetical protein